MTIENGSLVIPVEKIIDGEVVTVATKTIPILEIPMNAHEAANYSDNGAHNMTAEERAQGLEGRTQALQTLPHQRTNNSNNLK